MDIYKDISQEKRESLELAEASRECEWCYPSFVRDFFHGKVNWDLVFPFPEQSEADRNIGDDYLRKLQDFLQTKLNPDEVDRTGEIPQEVIQGLVDMGAFAMKIPAEYDGLGLSQINYNRAIHLVASYCGSTAVLLSAHQSIGVPYPLTLFGTEEQKRRYLPRFRKGAISGFALTEPGAGSDPRTMQTTAVPIEDGKDYLINGEKLWCSNGNIADILIVMCLTPSKIERGKEKKQITAFIVETNTPGFKVDYRCSFMGLNGVKLGLLKFNNVKVPRENILLGEGQGLKLAFVTLNTGRLTVPAAVTGMSKYCLFVARKWALVRKQWGAPVGEHQAIATKLSFMAAGTFAQDAVTWFTSHIADAKKLDIRLEAAMAKLFCTEASWQIVDDTLQIRGGRGFETSLSLKGRGEEGYAVERMFRDSRVNLIIEGTSQIMRLFIAREALDPHLKRIQAVLDPKANILKKIKLAVYLGGHYFFWWIKLCLPSFVPAKIAHLPSPLNQHMQFIQRTTKRLAKAVFLQMAIHQQRLESKQNILNRFVDIGTDLFVMSVACSYAASLVGQKKEGYAGSPIELADLFCREAKTRISRKFQDVCCNQDRISTKIAKKILSGEYEWLENDIIKE